MSPDMTNIEQLRALQHQRLVPSLALWNEAKKNLEDAIALTERREREHRELCDDVQRKIEAIDLVASLTRELDGKGGSGPRVTVSETPKPMQSTGGPERNGVLPVPELKEKAPVSKASMPNGAHVTRTTRPLFSLNRLSAIAGLTLTK